MVLQAGDDAAQAEELVPDETKYTAMKMDGLDDNFTNNWTKLVMEGTMDDVFIIEKVDYDYVSPVLFIHSCIPKIKEFISNLKFNPKELTSPYMKEFEELITSLVFFVLQHSDEKDPLKSDSSPNPQNQKFLREINIIDLLIDCLIYPFEGTEKPAFVLSTLD